MLAWPGWGPEMRALRLDHTALVRRGPTAELYKGRTYTYTPQSTIGPQHHGIRRERLGHGCKAAAGVAHRVGLECGEERTLRAAAQVERVARCCCHLDSGTRAWCGRATVTVLVSSA